MSEDPTFQELFEKSLLHFERTAEQRHAETQANLARQEAAFQRKARAIIDETLGRTDADDASEPLSRSEFRRGLQLFLSSLFKFERTLSDAIHQRHQEQEKERRRQEEEDEEEERRRQEEQEQEDEEDD